MLKALLKLILRSEFKELEDKKDLMDATIAEANKTVSNMKSAYGNCLELSCKRLESHEADLKKLQKQIELQIKSFSAQNLYYLKIKLFFHINFLKGFYYVYKNL